MNIHLVMKEYYTDFDIPKTMPIAAAKNLEVANKHKDKLNQSLSDAEKKEEVSYIIQSVKMLD